MKKLAERSKNIGTVDNNRKKKIWVHVILKTIFSLYLIIFALFTFYHVSYARKIIPGVMVNGIEVGGLTTDEALEKLQNDMKPNETVKITVGDNYNTLVTPEDMGFRYLYIDTIKKAFLVGREKHLVKSLITKINVSFNHC
jgi:hypothetical protein